MTHSKLLLRTVTLICLLCALCALLVLASCKPEDPTPTETDSAQETESTAPTTPAPDENGLALVKNGASNFKLVRCYGTQALRDGVTSIQRKVKQFTGVELPIVDADEITENDYCIVVGKNDDIPETKAVLDQKGYGNYGFYYQNKKLMILGATDTLNEKALNKFLTALNASLTKEKDMILKMGSIESEFVHNAWLEDVPHPTVEIDDVIDCNDSTFMLLKRGAQLSAYEAYVAQMAQSHYKLAQQNEINGVRFATYQSEKGQIMVSYAPTTHLFKIVCESFKTTSPIPNIAPETGYTKLTENKLSVMSLNYVASCTATDAAGLSLVLTLEDGRYIIIDGGYKADASGLYNYLVDNNKRSDGVTIAAWILTHSHSDHYSAFDSFANAYGKKVNCQYLISNTIPADYKPSKESNDTKISDMSRYLSKFANKDTKFIKPHAGQKLYFCNVELEMLYTHEELYPNKVAWINEASLAFHVKVGGQKILVMGDAELQAIDRMTTMYGSALKSDVLQIPHHGYTKIQQNFFDLVDAPVLIWPSNQETVNLRSSASWCSGLYKRLLENCDVCYVADGTVEILTLPYTFGTQYETYTMDFSKRS